MNQIAPVAPKWDVKLTSRVVLPHGLAPESRVPEAQLADCGRIHELVICGDGNVIEMMLEVNKHGSQIGNLNVMMQTESGMNIPSEVRMVMGLFLCLDFAGIAHLVKVEAVSG